MASHATERTRLQGAAGTTTGEAAGTTRALLGLGVLAGPFYLAVGLAQAFLREGFDLRRHALSLLSNGPGGWVQVANFLLSGLMVVGAAIGIRRVLRAQSRAAGVWLGAYGTSMIVAAFFRADPVDGFPVGTPEGYPTTISTTGLVHFAAGGVGFLALAVSCFVVARAMARRKDRSMAVVSLLCGLVVVVGFFGPMVLRLGGTGIGGIWLAVVVGWAWLAAVSLRLRRAAP